MADKKDSALEKVNFWKDRIATAKKHRDRVSDERGWERFIKEYNGDYGITLGGRIGRIKVPAINHVFSFVQSDIANMYFKDPYMSVNPKKTGNVRGAAILEVAVNYFWRVLDIKNEMESQMMDADLVGHGWNKDGYFMDSEGDEENTTILSEGIYSRKVSWRDVLFNIGSQKPPFDSTWMAQRIVKPISYIKKKYGVDVQGTSEPMLNEREFRDALFKDDIKVGVLWEIWDAENREILLLEDSHPTWIKKPRPWPEYIKSFPFNMLWYFERPDAAYPTSAIEIQEPQILEEIKLFAQALNHVKRWNRQAFVKRNAMNDEALDKFAEGTDGAVINVEGQGPLGDMVRFTDYGTLPQDIYNLLNRLPQLRSEISGQSEFQRGGVTRTNTRTIGELEAIDAGSKSRQDKRVDRLETHMEHVAKNLILHMQNNFSMEQIVKITGETPQEIIDALGVSFDETTKSVVFTKVDIEGDYDVDIKAGSTLPLTRQTKMAILRETLQMAVGLNGPLPPFAQVIITELLKGFDMPMLSEAFDFQNEKLREQQQQEAQEQDADELKKVSEAEKKQAQSKQIEVETEIMAKDDVRKDVQSLLGGGFSVEK